MCVINDPLGQTHSSVSSDYYFHLKFVLFCEIYKSGDGKMDVQTQRVKIMIPTVRDCGLPNGSLHFFVAYPA